MRSHPGGRNEGSRFMRVLIAGLYHETITWAYVALIHERVERRPAAHWEEFCRLNPDLLSWRPSILDRYYRPETLASDLARRVFVLPDAGIDYEELR